MEENKLLVSAAPHITARFNTRMLMGAVCLALCPTLVAAAIIFDIRVLLLTGVTVAACVIFEYVYEVLMKKPITIGDFSAVLTGLILAFNLPPNFPLWMAVIGAFVSIVITKQLFGGMGYNFANPALVGRIVLQLAFTAQMINYTYPAAAPDALAGATPLPAMQNTTLPFSTILFGTHGGTLGETCALTLLIGGIALMLVKVISPAIPVTYIGGAYVFTLLLDFGRAASANGFGGALQSLNLYAYNALISVMSGGLLLGAFFMATDYVTSPYTRKGKIVFGLGLAVITVAIRQWGNTTEGVSYSILLMNLLVPYINETCRQKPLGIKKRRKAKEQARKGAA